MLFISAMLHLVTSINLSEVTTPINLTEIGVFEPGALSIYKVGKHYLLSSTMPDEKIQIVDSQGQLLYQYTQQGQGSGELHYHSVLGIRLDKIYVHSRGPGILVFDTELKLLPESANTKKLPSDLAMVMLSGVSHQPNQILLSGHPLSKQHLFLFSLEDLYGKGAWKPTQKELQKRYPNKGFKDPEVSRYHQQTVFTYRTNLYDNRDQYAILVHKQFNDVWKPVAELVHSVEDFNPWLPPLKAMVNQVFDVGAAGYVVEVATGHPDSKSMFENTMYYDFFDSKGTFQKRIVKYNHRILPMVGSTEILKVVQEGDDDLLIPISLQELQPDL